MNNLTIQYFAYNIKRTHNMFQTFRVEFPDDQRTSHRIYFSDYGVKQTVVEYTIFLYGIQYPEINKNISFSHELLSEGVGDGLVFDSDIPLSSFSVSVLLIFDPRMIKFVRTYRTETSETQGALLNFQFERDYLDNPFILLVDGFRKSYYNMTGELELSLGDEDREGAQGSQYEGRLEIKNSGEQVTYKLIQV